MPNFKYLKVPMGYRQKFITINRLPNYALIRLSEGKFTEDERIAIRDFNFKANIKEARRQAMEILYRRGNNVNT